MIRAIDPTDRAAWTRLWTGYLTFYETTLPAAVYDETWRRIEHPDRRIRLVVEELVPELQALAWEDPTVGDPDFPFVLSAGERRSSTANTAYRDPSWRKRDASGALRIHPDDASTVGVDDGGLVRAGYAWARAPAAEAGEMRVEHADGRIRRLVVTFA